MCRTPASTLPAPAGIPHAFRTRSKDIEYSPGLGSTSTTVLAVLAALLVALITQSRVHAQTPAVAQAQLLGPVAGHPAHVTAAPTSPTHGIAAAYPDPPPPQDATLATPDAGPTAPSTAAPCALGEVCIGPVLNLGVVNPIGAGLHARLTDHFGVGVDYQILPEIVIGGADTRASLLSVDARVYPFGGPFFVSGGFAMQRVEATASPNDFGSVPARYQVDVTGAVDVPMLRFGFGVLGRSGLVLGIDLSLGIPLTGTTVQLNADYQGLTAAELAQVALVETRVRREVQSAVDAVLEVMPVLFQLNLLRVGYIF